MKQANSTIRITIVDDHPMIISGLENILSIAKHITISQTFTSGSTLQNSFTASDTDVLLLDVMLGDTTAEELVPQLLQLYPEVKILLVSSIDNLPLIRKLIKMGVKGYVLKTVAPHQLIEAIESIHANQTYLSEDLKEAMLQTLLTPKKLIPLRGLQLTRRELEVLKEISLGLTGKAIADKLNISINTVETHKRNLFLKLDVKNAISLTNKAIEMGLLP